MVSRYFVRIGLAAIALLGMSRSTFAVNANGDGMSDVWKKHFALPAGSGPNDDADGDGMTNLQESIAGTDPLNAADVFRARMETVGDALYLKWPSVAAKLYTIEKSTDLATWAPLGASVAGTGTEIAAQLPAPTAAIYYRVSVRDQNSDSDSLTDWEEMILGTNPNIADTDGDGVNDDVEYLQGTDPLDYYNGVVPSVTIVSSAPAVFAPRSMSAGPITIEVRNGGNLANNAPVTFSVVSGDSQLSLDGSAVVSAPQSLRTDSSGRAQIWVKSGNSFTFNTVRAVAGTASPVDIAFRPVGDYSDFFAYYEGELEIAGISSFYGRVHSNGTAYVESDSDGSTTFYADISAQLGIIKGVDPNSPNAASINNLPYSYTLAPGVRRDSLSAAWVNAPAFNSGDSNPNNDDPRELIESANLSYPDSFQQIRLANLASIVIEINSANTMNPTATVYVRNAPGQPLTAAPFSLRTNVTSAMRTPGQSSTIATTINDFRESSVIYVTSFDVHALLQAASAFASFNGIIFVEDATTVPAGGPKRTIRFFNGATIPDLTSTNDPTGGLSLVSPNPVFLQGDFNCGSSPYSNTAAGQTSRPSTVDVLANNRTGDAYFQSYPVGSGYVRRPAMIACDAFTAFSNSWSDANSSIRAPFATSTTMNLLVLTGDVPTVSMSYSGGLANVVRLAENWSGRSLTIYGAFAVLFPSEIFTGQWMSQSYTPPNRAWYYDPMFQTTPPPGLPQIQLAPAQ